MNSWQYGTYLETGGGVNLGYNRSLSTPAISPSASVDTWNQFVEEKIVSEIPDSLADLSPPLRFAPGQPASTALPTKYDAVVAEADMSALHSNSMAFSLPSISATFDTPFCVGSETEYVSHEASHTRIYDSGQIAEPETAGASSGGETTARYSGDWLSPGSSASEEADLVLTEWHMAPQTAHPLQGRYDRFSKRESGPMDPPRSGQDTDRPSPLKSHTSVLSPTDVSLSVKPECDDAEVLPYPRYTFSPLATPLAHTHAREDRHLTVFAVCPPDGRGAVGLTGQRLPTAVVFNVPLDETGMPMVPADFLKEVATVLLNDDEEGRHKRDQLSTHGCLTYEPFSIRRTEEVGAASPAVRNGSAQATGGGLPPPLSTRPPQPAWSSTLVATRNGLWSFSDVDKEPRQELQLVPSLPAVGNIVSFPESQNEPETERPGTPAPAQTVQAAPPVPSPEEIFIALPRNLPAQAPPHVPRLQLPDPPLPQAPTESGNSTKLNTPPSPSAITARPDFDSYSQKEVWRRTGGTDGVETARVVRVPSFLAQLDASVHAEKSEGLLAFPPPPPLLQTSSPPSHLHPSDEPPALPTAPQRSDFSYPAATSTTLDSTRRSWEVFAAVNHIDITGTEHRASGLQLHGQPRDWSARAPKPY